MLHRFFLQIRGLASVPKKTREKPEMFPMKCFRCADSGWTCEDRPDRPWQGPRACTCGGAGMPCPDCNRPDDDDEVPRLPFTPDDDSKRP
jgi:hypothetical protein